MEIHMDTQFPYQKHNVKCFLDICSDDADGIIELASRLEEAALAYLHEREQKWVQVRFIGPGWDHEPYSYLDGGFEFYVGQKVIAGCYDGEAIVVALGANSNKRPGKAVPACS